MKLYHYWRSTSSWRVRWALEYKKIPCELIPINLLNGEAETPEHLKRHPAGFVPVLETDQGDFLVESLAIISYLEEMFPSSPSLYPKNPLEKSKALSLAEIINAGTHPLQNPPVLAFHSSDPEKQTAWAQHWIHHGLQIFENLCAHPFAVSSGFSIADLCLLPQLYNAKRYNVNLNSFPKIQLLQKHMSEMESYQRSHADRYKPVDA